jgi:outer membrane receptor protein involved in Fe transport
MKHIRARGAIALAALGTTAAAVAAEPEIEPTYTEEVHVEARADDLVGIATSATEGATGAEDLRKRPLLRPGEIVETIPGVIATQHSGGGKANQYFLRGFNLDHGTDLRISVDGMQVNLPTHGHGQGYADMNFVIPELVDSVRFRKGGYDATVGDFSSAGSTEVRLADELPHPRLLLSGGGDGYGRALALGSTALGGGRLLLGVEYFHDDGPWVRADDFTKLNGLVRYARGDRERGWSLGAMAYDGTWDATDQVPARAAGVTIDRFGPIDPALGGSSSRYSLSFESHRLGADSRREVGAYVLDYDLDLLSNFTYCLDGGTTTSCAVDDDEFLQRDERIVLGARLDQRWRRTWNARPVEWGIGADLQLHAIENGLHRTAGGTIRQPGGTIREDEVTQWFGGVFAEAEVRFTDRLRSVAGLRADHVGAEVDSDRAANSGERSDSILSPKLSLIAGLAPRTELYLNYGRGFHSNDARGMVTTVDPVTLETVERADPLVRSDTADVGLRTTALRGLQSTLTVFWIELDSELVFVGDAGTTEPGPPSRRVGVELGNFYRPKPWLSVDLDLTWADAEFLDVPAGADHIPGALETTAAAGIALGRETGPSGALRWRYFGEFPLVEDDSVRGDASSLVNARVGYTFGNGFRIFLDAFNLLDAEDADIQYFYASRLPAAVSPTGAAEPVVGVEDVHFHPMVSRTLRLSLEFEF